jgi:hypothetical protein
MKTIYCGDTTIKCKHRKKGICRNVKECAIKMNEKEYEETMK